MENYNLDLISISDIHFGHKKVKTKSIVNKLKKYLFPHLNKKVFLVISGDIFDQNLSLSDSSVLDIISFFIELFNILEKNKSILRIIRGTYIHDRDQIKVIQELYYSYKYSFNFKYIHNIELEIIESLNNLKVIYIPDDLQHFSSSSDVIFYIKEKMKLLDISKIDYVFGHGNFAHIFPNNITLPKITFTYNQFKNIVNKLILFGHIHIHSIYKNIIYNGSFDRLQHGEPYKKGFIKISNFLSNEYKINFIENKEATIFYDLKWNNSIENFIKRLDNFLNNYSNIKDIIYIRCIDVPNEYKYTIQSYLKNNYSLISVSFISSKFINESSNIDISKIDISINNYKKWDKILQDSKYLENYESITKFIQSKLKQQFNIQISLDQINKYIYNE